MRGRQRELHRLFRDTLRVLRAECPLPVGVTVRARLARDIYPWFGCTSAGRIPGHISLRVATRYKDKQGHVVWVTDTEFLDAINHEWAHALHYRPEDHHAVEDHDAVWGVNYARAYNATAAD